MLTTVFFNFYLVPPRWYSQSEPMSGQASREMRAQQYTDKKWKWTSKVRAEITRELIDNGNAGACTCSISWQAARQKGRAHIEGLSRKPWYVGIYRSSCLFKACSVPYKHINCCEHSPGRNHICQRVPCRCAELTGSAIFLIDHSNDNPDTLA